MEPLSPPSSAASSSCRLRHRYYRPRRGRGGTLFFSFFGFCGGGRLRVLLLSVLSVLVCSLLLRRSVPVNDVNVNVHHQWRLLPIPIDHDIDPVLTPPPPPSSSSSSTTTTTTVTTPMPMPPRLRPPKTEMMIMDAKNAKNANESNEESEEEEEDESSPLRIIALKRRPLIPGNTPAFYQAYGVSSSADVAVVSLIGGMNPDNHNNDPCLGFFYNVLVTAQRLQDEHSSAEMVVMLQLSPSSSPNATTLPAHQIAALEAMQIRIYYIPKPVQESFHDAMLDKFRILDLIQYQRVLFLDADAMPLSSLNEYLLDNHDLHPHHNDQDHHYHHHDPNENNHHTPQTLTNTKSKLQSTLKSPLSYRFRPNIVTPSPMVPSHGGFFVLTPGENEYQRLLDIVLARITDTNNNDTTHNHTTKTKTTIKTAFDVVRGWGHVFTPDDPWMDRTHNRQHRQTQKKKKKKNKNPQPQTTTTTYGLLWDFHGASADQGLLYYWTKYVKQSVSIVFHDQLVENWGFDASQQRVALQEIMPAPPFKVWNSSSSTSSSLSSSSSSSSSLRSMGDCHKFVCDMAHFTGQKKPWLSHPPPPPLLPLSSPIASSSQISSPQQLWWHTLRRLDQKLHLQLDFDHWSPQLFKKPPLGSGPQASLY